MKAQLRRLQTLAIDFLHWWRSELRALLPARWRASLAQDRAQLFIALNEQHIDIARFHRGEVVQHRADAPLEALGEADWNELSALCSETRTHLALLPAQQLALNIELPHAALSRVDAAIGYQLARHAPIDPAALLWTRRIAQRHPKSCTLAVTLARRGDAEAVQALFAARDIGRPTIVSSDDNPPQILLRGEDASLTDAVLRNRRAAWIALALTASIPFTSLTLLAAKRQEAENRLSALTNDASSAARASAALSAATDSARALQALARLPAVSTQLAGPAAALPDGAILSGFAHKRGARMQLRLTLPAGLDPAAIGFTVTDVRPLPDGRTAITADAGR